MPIGPRSACTARSIVQSAAEIAVHLDQLIPGADAGPLAGRAGHRRHDGDPAVPGVDLEPDAAVVTGGALLQPLVVLAGEQRGVGIVQLLEHAVDRPVVELALGKRVDVVVPHVLEHLLEQARLLIDVRCRRRGGAAEASRR